MLRGAEGRGPSSLSNSTTPTPVSDEACLFLVAGSPVRFPGPGWRCRLSDRTEDDKFQDILGIHISQTDEMLFSPPSTFAVLTFYGDKTYIPEGCGDMGSRVHRPGFGSFVQRWGQWMAGACRSGCGPLCGGGQSMAGLAGLGVRFRQLC